MKKCKNCIHYAVCYTRSNTDNDIDCSNYKEDEINIVKEKIWYEFIKVSNFKEDSDIKEIIQLAKENTLLKCLSFLE